MRTLKHVIFSEPIGSVLKIYGLQKLQYFKAIDKQITSENKQMPAMLQPVMWIRILFSMSFFHL